MLVLYCHNMPAQYDLNYAGIFDVGLLEPQVYSYRSKNYCYSLNHGQMI